MNLQRGIVPVAVAALMVSGCSAKNPSPRLSASPTASSTARSAQRWTPQPGSSFQVQYAGKLDLGVQAQVFDLDYEGASADEVSQLHRRGAHVVCYFNAGAREDWRGDKDAFPASAVGRPLNGWPGEQWLDVNQVDALMPVMERRLDVCAHKGFDAVDADNVDGYTQDSGFRITPDAQLRYNTALARAAHARGLAMGLKNDTDQLTQLADEMDFAVNEECVAYKECGVYAPFLAQGKAVFNIEYQGTAATVCPGRPDGLTTVIKLRDLTAARVTC